jgi:hypothetical protein
MAQRGGRGMSALAPLLGGKQFKRDWPLVSALSAQDLPSGAEPASGGHSSAYIGDGRTLCPSANLKTPWIPSAELPGEYREKTPFLEKPDAMVDVLAKIKRGS